MGLKKPLIFSLMVILAVWVSSLGLITQARAHEVQPTVMDATITPERLEITAEWMIEAAVAGLDLTDLADTSDAENDSEYDRLRSLEPSEMEAAVREVWPEIAANMQLESGGTRLTPILGTVEVPAVGNTELSRLSTLRITADLPPGDAPVTIGWASELGPLVVRQAGIEGGYAAYLTPGTSSDPIPRTGTSEQGAWSAFVDYVSVGFDHIVPQGLDHILFVLGLFFLSLHMRPLLMQVTAFTLAHTVTLALGAMNIIRLPAEIVEPLIAASIMYVGIENLVLRRMAPWRPIVVFCFGLLHGLGFAAVLQDFGLGADNFVAKLIGFNVGVEIGQLAVIATAWLVLAAFFGRFDWYHRRIGAPVSVAIAMVAAFWVLERTGTIDATGPWSLFSALTEGGFHPMAVTIGAIVVATVLTALVMVLVAVDGLRDLSGFVTSFAMFLAIIATFTTGAWVLTVAIAIAWVVSLRLQSLGGPVESLA